MDRNNLGPITTEPSNSSSAVVTGILLLSLLVVHWVQSCCFRRTEQLQKESSVLKQMKQTLALSHHAVRTLTKAVQRGVTRHEMLARERTLFADLGYFRCYRFHLVPFQEEPMRFGVSLQYKRTNAYASTKQEPFLSGAKRSAVEMIDVDQEEYTLETDNDLEIRLPDYRALEEAYLSVNDSDPQHTTVLQALRAFPAQLEVSGSNDCGMTWTTVYEGDATNLIQANITRTLESLHATLHDLQKTFRPYQFSTV